MKDRKWKLQTFSFYDITGMEAHLEAMAQKGWMLEKLGNFFWTYRRCTPQSVHFAVTYYPPASAFEPEPSEGQQTFTDFCDHAGWRLVGSNAQMMIFANEREDPVPIHTDPLPEIESLERMSKRVIWAWVMLLVIMVFNLWMFVGRLLHEPMDLLSSPLQLFNGVTMSAMGLYFAAELWTWLRWRKRARAAAAQGEFLPTRGHWKLFRVILYIVLGSLLYVLLADRQPGYRTLLLVMLAGYFVLFAAVNGVRTTLQKKKVSTGKNRTITLIVDVVLAIALSYSILWAVFRIDFPSMETKEMVVTVQDLTGEPDSDMIQETSFSSSSFLLSRQAYFQHPPFNQPKNDIKDLRYTQLDVHFPLLYKICLHQLLHQYDTYGDHDPNYDEARPFYVYQEVDAAAWGAETVYQRYSYGKPDFIYLLCWPDRIVEFEPSWSLNEDQMAIAGAAFAP